MKLRFSLLLIILGFLYSCEKEKDQSETFLVVGSKGAIITSLDTLITPISRCNSVLYQIDIDSDGLKDFGFYIYYCYSPSHYNSTFRFDCLNTKCKVLCNDSTSTPEILNIGDTLVLSDSWKTQNMNMLSVNEYLESIGGDMIYLKNGIWQNCTNKYIGVLIEKDKGLIYGWIKLSIPNNSWTQSLTIHEIGYKEATYIPK